MSEVTTVKNNTPAPINPAEQVLRNVAIFRCIIFGILVFEWNCSLSFAPVRPGTDSWFTYDQFEIFHHITPHSADPNAELKCKIISVVGTAAGITAA